MTPSSLWRLFAILSLHTLLFLPSGALAAQDEDAEESEGAEEGSETESDQDTADTWTEDSSAAEADEAEAAAPEAPKREVKPLPESVELRIRRRVQGMKKK